jgi:hypothetical protein
MVGRARHFNCRPAGLGSDDSCRRHRSGEDRLKGTFVTPDQVVDGELVIDGGTITCVAVTCESPTVATRLTVTNSERNPCSSRGVQSCTALEAAIDHHSAHGTTCVVRSRPVGWCGDLGAARGRPTTITPAAGTGHAVGRLRVPRMLAGILRLAEADGRAARRAKESNAASTVLGVGRRSREATLRPDLRVEGRIRRGGLGHGASG